jgi:sortase A
MWLVNPYAAALVAPATHLWLWATVPQARIARPVALVLVLSALLPLAAVAVSDARLFQLGAIESAWFWTQLVAGGHVPALSWLLWSAFWACASRHRRPRPVSWRRRAARALSTVLIVAGGLMLVDAGVTLLWQEPITAVQSAIRQHALGNDLGRLERQGPTRIERRALARLRTDNRRIAFLARSLRRRAPEGSAIGRIEIPRAGVDFVLVKGSKPDDLRRGPGVYDQTPFPGVPGTTGIAGHRTTHGAPFRHIDRLRAGDSITVKMPYATFSYRVERRKIVDPSAVWITHRVDYDRVVLSACHPLFSAAQRIVVFAKLARVVPTSETTGGRGSEARLAGLTPGKAWADAS